MRADADTKQRFGAHPIWTRTSMAPSMRYVVDIRTLSPPARTVG